MTVQVAAFDVDGTLTVRDCVVPFLRRAAGVGSISRRLAQKAHLVVPAVARRDRDLLKAVAAAAAFRGRSVTELRELAVRFGHEVADRGLRDDTVARLRWHQGQGHQVVLVSASFELYLETIGERLGVDAVLGTRLAVDDAGRFTGALDGPNCRGPEKVRRLHEWLGAAHGGRATAEVWAYGDSPGDRELLGDADHPVWVTTVLSSVAPSC